MSDKGVFIKWYEYQDKSTTLSEKFLYKEIESLSMLYLGCIAKNEHFSDLMGIKKHAVSRLISNLEGKGFITVNIKNGSRNHNRKMTIKKALTTPSQIVNPPSQFVINPITNCDETKGNKSINKPINNTNVIFEYWKLIFNKPKTKLFAERKKKIETALKTFSVDELKKAIDGISKSKYHIENNYISIDLIFRNSSKIEQNIERNEVNQNATNRQNNQKRTSFERGQDAIAELNRQEQEIRASM